MGQRDLIRVIKDGQVAVCERRQLAAMEKAEWKIAPPVPKEQAKVEETAVAPKDRLQRLHRDGETAYADRPTLQSMLDAGWKPGEPPPVDDDLASLLTGLDPDDEGLWNADGSLKMGAFNDAFERKETKATIATAWPDFSRDALIAVQAEE